MWGVITAVLKGNFIASNTCIRKKEKCQIGDLGFYFKQETDEQMKPKVNKLKKNRGNNTDQHRNQWSRKQK